MTQETHIVNLDLPAEKRWSFLEDSKDKINSLLECYLNDFEGSEFIFDSIEEYKNCIIPLDYLNEISFISSLSKFSENEVLIANLYYDVLKFYFGCTAFATAGNNTIYHARNLDWHTENNLLSDYSVIFDFQRQGCTQYKTVGWFGFIGALSGIKPGKFSVTLNAVLSDDSPEIAYPISFLLRDVLDKESSYQSAKQKLEEITIASDCLLLLSGVTPKERVVIERTPKRFASRESTNNQIVVTNDYKKLENTKEAGGLLQSTSCGRFDKALEMLNSGVTNSEDCLKILQNEDIMMGITVQQMCFNNLTGDIELIKTVGSRVGSR